MKKFYSLLALSMLALVLAVGGCNDSDDDDSPVVHVGGFAGASESQVPVVWINSEDPDILPCGDGHGGIEGIFATKDDVYACGSYKSDAIMRPAYWKNGVKTNLPVLYDIAGDGLATGIVESGGSVHVSGGVPDKVSTLLPAYWKDGELTTLPVVDSSSSGGGIANAICVSGTTVYVGGFCNINKIAYPTYWADGARVEMDVPEKEGYDLANGIVYSITVDGDDIYAAGIVSYTDYTEEIRKAVLWKNGEPTPLTPVDNAEKSEALSVAVADGHVYVAGLYKRDGLAKPCLWTDGEIQELSMIDSDLLGSAEGVVVHDGKVYVCGDTTKITDPDEAPTELTTYGCYWVNGERVDLPSASEAPGPNTVALDICVTD